MTEGYVAKKDVLTYLDEIPALRQAVADLTLAYEQEVEQSQPDASTAVAGIQESIEFLGSSVARDMVARDPYWPKWDSPWWHALLLEELGLAAEIPREFLDTYAEIVDKHYLHFFPFTEEEVPADVSPIFNIACHCYLGSVFRWLITSGQFDSELKPVDGRILAGRSSEARVIPSDSFDASPEHERALSWVRPWFLKYQIDGGGLNCDESNYLKDTPSCSVLSTVPALEALVAIDTNLLSEEELTFLDNGVNYLLERNLFRSKRTGEVIDPNWLEPAFPRFYYYDVLRGLTLVTRWALKRSRKLSRAAIAEALDLLAEHVTKDGFVPKRSNVQDHTTTIKTDEGHERGHVASSFNLLEAVDQPGKPSLHLSQEYLGLMLRLKYMSDARLLKN